MTRFLFFGGKGGVGKTTCAAAHAIAAARAGQGVLLVSTDPAHSLGDALATRLGARVRSVRVGRSPARRSTRRVPSLDAVEIDARRAFERWLAAHGSALADVIEHGTWLGRAEVDELLDLSIPGVDELVALMEIRRLAGSSLYDLVVIDTAPTGHMLRMLAAPDAVAAVAGVLESMQETHRAIREQLTRVRAPDAADRLVALLAADARELAGLLTDTSRTAFHWVLLPEALSLAESEDGIDALTRSRVAVPEVIVNRVTPDGPACPLCDPRRAEERRLIRTIIRRLGPGRAVRTLAAELDEPRGLDQLVRFGDRLVNAAKDGAPRTPPQMLASNSRRPRIGPAARPAVAARRPPESLPALRGARLLLFGGKGGVGKTTCAAAAALGLARARPEARVLVMSIDPAHSLGDVLRARVGDRPSAVRGAPPNLSARELDAAAVLASRRARLESAFAEIAAAVGSTSIGGETSAELVDLAPPGIDELLGMLALTSEDHDVIVVDTAPTGHTLRLLEMPDAALAWIQALMRVLLKYRAVLPPGRLGQELVELSRSIRAFRDVLHSPRAGFVVVTRAGEVVRAETELLMSSLKRSKIAVPAVIVNAMTLAPGDCPICRATAEAERMQATAVARTCRRRSLRCAMIHTPLVAPPPRGPAALEKWAASWTGTSQ